MTSIFLNLSFKLNTEEEELLLFLLSFIATVLKSIFPFFGGGEGPNQAVILISVREDRSVNFVWLAYLFILGKCNMAAAMETEQLGVEIFETAECEENIESQDRLNWSHFMSGRYSWSQLKKLLIPENTMAT